MWGETPSRQSGGARQAVDAAAQAAYAQAAPRAVEEEAAVDRRPGAAPAQGRAAIGQVRLQRVARRPAEKPDRSLRPLPMTRSSPRRQVEVGQRRAASSLIRRPAA